MRNAVRIVTALFGLFLLGVGLYALFLADTPIARRVIGGAVLIALGANTVYDSCTGKRSWLFRIGLVP